MNEGRRNLPGLKAVPMVRNYTLVVLKIVAPLLLIAWLLASIEPARWQELGARRIHWGLLFVAFAIEFGALCLTFIRWYLLVRSLGIRFSLADAFRLSFLGYMFNFVSVGSVGGDLFKAIFVAREQPGRRTEAVATVVLDRVIGMYALMLVASAAILFGGIHTTSPTFHALQQITLATTAGGGLALLAASVPAVTDGRMARCLTALPWIGDSCERLIASLRVYRRRRLMMAAIFCMSMLVHGLISIGVFLIALAVFGNCPPLVDHLVIVPLSMVAGALPFTPSGLGSFEFAMDELFRLASTAADATVSGVLIALVYRLVTIANAGVGVVYYWMCKAKVEEVLEAAGEAAG
jgi:uncharacterized membrane protein YbhN (UPF0104 family)